MLVLLVSVCLPECLAADKEAAGRRGGSVRVPGSRCRSPLSIGGKVKGLLLILTAAFLYFYREEIERIVEGPTE